jgi:hypothetical protein
VHHGAAAQGDLRLATQSTADSRNHGRYPFDPDFGRLFRLLIIDLHEQRVSIGFSVEIAIVSVLREVIVSGVLETDWRQVLAVCLFLARSVGAPPPFCSGRHQEGLHRC